MIHQEKSKKRQSMLEMKQKENKIITKKREQQLRLKNDREENLKKSLLKKFQDDGEYLSAVFEERQKELQVEVERKELVKQLKLDNVERMKRKQDYERQETLRKMTESERRTEEMLRKKGDLVQQCRLAAREAKIQKDKIISIVEQSKMGGGRSIQKIISAIETGVPNTKKVANRENDDGEFVCVRTCRTDIRVGEYLHSHPLMVRYLLPLPFTVAIRTFASATPCFKLPEEYFRMEKKRTNSRKAIFILHRQDFPAAGV